MPGSLLVGNLAVAVVIKVGHFPRGLGDMETIPCRLRSGLKAEEETISQNVGDQPTRKTPSMIGHLRKFLVESSKTK